ncbi:hypothetical protein [Oscillibacter valericigenes]|nr:hypothetical protein [Oscillibacter valericigenes]
MLTGFHHAETIENTCKSPGIVLSDEDAQLLSKTAKPAQVMELDK